MVTRPKKITPYVARRTATGRFARPNIQDYSVDVVGKLVRNANEVLDEKAKTEGYAAGQKAQADTLKEGQAYINVENEFTIAGDAYKRGANAAYIAGTRSKFKNELNTLRKRYDGSTIEFPVPDFDGFKNAAEELRSDYVGATPSHLQPDLTQYFDAIVTDSANRVTTAKNEYDKQAFITTLQTSAIEDITELENIITLYGINSNQITDENGPMQVIAKIEQMDGTLSPAKAYQLKEELITKVKFAAIRHGYNLVKNSGGDVELYIDSVRDGGEQYQTIMTEVQDFFAEAGVDFGTTLTVNEQIKISNELFTTYQKDLRIMESGFDTAFENFKNSIVLEESGTNSGYNFSEQEWKEFGKSQSDIDIYKDLWDDALVKGSFAKKMQTVTMTEHSQEVANIEKQIDTLTSNLETGLVSDGPAGQVRELSDEEKALIRDDLIMWKEIETNVKTELAKKQAIIAKQDGSEWALVSQAGHELDFSTPEKIEEMHILKKKITNVKGWHSTLLPKAELDNIKNTIERATASELLDGDNSVFAVLQAQFGKYLPQLLRDLEFDRTGMKHVFDFMNMGNVNAAKKVLEGLTTKDLEKQVKGMFTDEGEWSGIEKKFNSEFNKIYEEALRSNPKLYASLRDATYAHFLANLGGEGGGMDSTLAIANALSNMGNAYVVITLDANGQSLLIPNTTAWNVDEIQAKLSDFMDNAIDYPLFTGEGYTISDVLKNKQNYRFVIDGNGIYFVPESTNLAITPPLYEKQPSGENEFNIAVPNIEVVQDASSTTETNDVEKTKVYAGKPDNWNEEFIKNLKTTKKQKQTFYNTTAQVPLDELGTEIDVPRNDFVEQLYVAFFDHQKVLDNKDKYTDIHVGELTNNNEEKMRLNAISFYIKDGDIEEWMIDYLEDTLRLGDYLKNPSVRAEIIRSWKDNTQRTFVGSGQEMSPLRALESYASQIYKELNRLDGIIEDINKDGVVSDAETIIQGEIAKEKLGLSENNLLVDTDILNKDY